MSWRRISGIAISVINPVRERVAITETAGLRMRRARYQRGRAYQRISVIRRRDMNSEVIILRRPTRVSGTRYASFDFTEGRSAFPTIIPSLTGTKNELCNRAVTCPYEIQVTGMTAYTLGRQCAVSIRVQ